MNIFQRKRRGRKKKNKEYILDNLDLKLKAQEFYALIGLSGSGKTMTALSILRLLPSRQLEIKKGEILFQNIDLLKLPLDLLRLVRANEISFIFQEPASALNPLMTIRKHFDELCYYYKRLISNLDFLREKYPSYLPIFDYMQEQKETRLIIEKNAEDRIFELLEKVGFSDFSRILGAYPYQLSGGMLQRVMIAMSLLLKPKLLIADEITSALDVTVQAYVMELLNVLRRSEGMATLFITHNIDLVFRYSEKVGIIENGKISQERKTKDLLYSTSSKKKSTASDTKVFLPSLLNYEDKFLDPSGELKGPSTKEQREKKSLLSVRNLRVYFPYYKKNTALFKKKEGDLKVVDGVSLEIHSSEILAIVGESGCGKSTIAMSLLALLDSKFTYGKFTFFSEHKKDLDMHRSTFKDYYEKYLRKEVQIIFQDSSSSLNPRYNIYEILKISIERYHKYSNIKLPPQNKIKEEVAKLLERVGLSSKLMFRYPHAFSGGQRQRINIARVLALKPKILVCDEILSSLDVFTQKKIIDLLLSLKKEYSLSLIWISHDLKLVSYFSHWIYVVYAGRVVESSPTAELFKNPLHPYTKALLEAIPSRYHRKKIKVLTGEAPSLTEEIRGCSFYGRCDIREDSCLDKKPPLLSIQKQAKNRMITRERQKSVACIHYDTERVD